MGVGNRMIMVRSCLAPTVEINTSVGTAYVRFASDTASIARSEHVDRAGYPIVTIDYDKEGQPIGVELQGVVEFSVGRLLELAQIEAPNADLTNARYIGVGHPGVG